MTDPIDLHDFDIAWLAVDECGQVGIFTTAGKGPVPTSALPHLDVSEELVRALPEFSKVMLEVSYVKLDEFVWFAQRGCFVYDWSDAHRVASRELNGYELIACPVSPVLLKDLPPQIAAVVGATQIPGVTFGVKILPKEWILTSG